MSKKALKFEQALKKLELSVEKLNSSDLPLDDSIKVFEEGMELALFCEKKLNEAEGKVESILKSFEENKKV
jgi:exodeoxyribonuclease VII small subunit